MTDVRVGDHVDIQIHDVEVTALGADRVTVTMGDDVGATVPLSCITRRLPDVRAGDVWTTFSGVPLFGVRSTSGDVRLASIVAGIDYAVEHVLDVVGSIALQARYGDGDGEDS